MDETRRSNALNKVVLWKICLTIKRLIPTFFTPWSYPQPNGNLVFDV